MRIVLLGGAGLMGRATARDLVEHAPETELVIADLNGDAAVALAEQLVEAVAAAQVSGTAVDAMDEAQVRGVIRGADAVINATQYYTNLVVMRAAVAERVPYVDLGGLYHMTLEQLQLDAEFRSAGVTAVLGMGSTPGVTNVQAAHAAAMLDTVERVAIYNGNTPTAAEPSAWGYSIHTILDEMSKRPVVFRDGRIQELDPFSELAPFDFLDPIGTQDVHHSLHSELATLPAFFEARGVREVTFKLNRFGFSPAAASQLEALVRAGMASTDPVEVRAQDGDGRRQVVHVRPRDVLIAALVASAAQRADGAEAQSDDPFVIDHEEVVVEVAGTRAGAPATVRVDTIARGREDWRLSGGTLLTATPPGIIGLWLADRSLAQPGVHAPESVVDPARLFAALEERGMATTTQVSA